MSATRPSRFFLPFLFCAVLLATLFGCQDQKPPEPSKSDAKSNTKETAAKPQENRPAAPKKKPTPTPIQPATPSDEPTPTEPPQPPAPLPPTPTAPFKSDRPAKEATPGYYLRTPEKFTVYVSRLAYEKSDELEGGPLKMVDEELSRISNLFPEASLKALRTMPIWVDWNEEDPRSPKIVAVYMAKTVHNAWMEGSDPRKAGCVWMLSLKKSYESRQSQKSYQYILLHEMGHAIHHKVFKFDDPLIKTAYAQAAQRELYLKVKHDNGTEGPAYAGTNELEYFAELSCAYLDRLQYYPHDAAELKEHDPVGYELMTKVYGTREAIAAAKKKETEKGQTAAAPSPPTVASSASDKDAIAKLTKDLKSQDTQARLKAVEQLGGLGEAAARPLCAAMLDSNSKVAKAALIALEKAHPGLYKQVSTMVLDEDVENRLAAINVIGTMEKEGLPALDLLIARAKDEFAKVAAGRVTDQTALAYLKAIGKVGGDDQECVKFFRGILTSPQPAPRKEALDWLLSWAGDTEARRKELVPLIKPYIKDTPAAVPFIEAAARMGAMSKDLVPGLKQLKLSKNSEVRDAAAKAVEAIEQK